MATTISSQQAARYMQSQIGVTVSTNRIVRLIAGGYFTARKFSRGGQWRIDYESFVSYLEKAKAGAFN